MGRSLSVSSCSAVLGYVVGQTRSASQNKLILRRWCGGRPVVLTTDTTFTVFYISFVGLILLLLKSIKKCVLMALRSTTDRVSPPPDTKANPVNASPATAIFLLEPEDGYQSETSDMGLRIRKIAPPDGSIEQTKHRSSDPLESL